jgi:putative MATE family efflux protein
MSKGTKDILLERIREGAGLSLRDRIILTAYLSVPAMLAQLMQILMEYIDAAMVGSLGATASASIGLVSSSTWLMGGLCNSVGAGFCVQVAHQIGAKRNQEARNILRIGLVASLVFSILLCAIGLVISPYLPHWLGGSPEIVDDASIYFAIFTGMIPLMMLLTLSTGMLRSVGNVKVPSILLSVACVLDVVFNSIFIFHFHMGVLGAAIGSALAYFLIALVTTAYLLLYNDTLKLSLDKKGSNEPTSNALNESNLPHEKTRQRLVRILKKWWHIAWPMGAEHFVMCAAQIASTIIIAPLGTIAIAANAFGIIIEGLCYMPGFGIADAATTLVGQSIGAQRTPLARSFARISVGMGMIVMTVMGIIMFVGAPYVMALMTPDLEVQALTTYVLRIEAFAEPMFAAAIVSYGAFVGAGDTLVPCGMNLASIWLVRISLALIFTKVLGFGLVGYWIAMALELGIRGTIFLLRLRSGSWTVKMRI